MCILHIYFAFFTGRATERQSLILQKSVHGINWIKDLNAKIKLKKTEYPWNRVLVIILNLRLANMWCRVDRISIWSLKSFSFYHRVCFSLSGTFYKLYRWYMMLHHVIFGILILCDVTTNEKRRDILCTLA